MTPQRYVLGIAHQAGRDDRIAKGVDGHRDWFTPDELERAAWRFLAKSRSVGLFHVGGTEGTADVVESYIYRGPDWQVAPDLVVKSGDWLVGAVLSPFAWSLLERGLVDGWSILGTGIRIATTKE